MQDREDLIRELWHVDPVLVDLHAGWESINAHAMSAWEMIGQNNHTAWIVLSSRKGKIVT